MKTRNSHRVKAKKSKSVDYSGRSQGQQDSSPPTPKEKRSKSLGDYGHYTLSNKELQSLSAAYHKRSHHCECPVEVQGQQQLPSAKERNILIQEMEAEFLNRKKVTIFGLPVQSTTENLAGFFQEFQCMPVTRVKDGSIRVMFQSHESANSSLSILNSTVLDFHQLTASYSHTDSLLFAGNLPLTFTRDDLAALFAPHGDILRCLVVYSAETGLNKGYGFVEYTKREEALLAKQHMSNKVVGLRSLRVDFSDNGMQRCQDLQSETLFVDRLPKGYQDEEKLRKKFEYYGTVKFCQVALAAGTGVSRGFAFVDMGDCHEAERAQLACNGVLFAGQEIRVSFGMPCRHGSCILQHNSLKASTALPISSHTQPHWGQRVIMQSQSEECLLAHHVKLRPLADSTNTKSDTCLLMRRASLTHLGCSTAPLLQQYSLGHSFSTSNLCTLNPSNLCTQLHPPLHIVTPHQMEEESDATSYDHPHQEVLTLQDRAAVCTSSRQVSPPGSPKHHSTMCPSPIPPICPPLPQGCRILFGPESPDLQGGVENEVPMLTEDTCSPPSPTSNITYHQVADSMLGKRLAAELPSVAEAVWVYGDTGGCGWACDEGVYDQPYIGQHQQGIPFTHPLKRIRMGHY